MKNYKLTIQYDGTNYSGWQIQKNAVSVQEKLVSAIEMITKEKINLIGSGRTDTGVHAYGQVANFRSEQQIDHYKFVYSLNSVLPKDISVIEMKNVDKDFHARFDAKNRAYIYMFSKLKSPFFDKYSYFYPLLFKNEISRIKKLSETFLGEHDFTSFSIKNTEVENKLCSITEINWRLNKDKLIFYISANRFLHGMVRTIIGTLLTALENNFGGDYILDVLEKKDRSAAGESVPAKGLFLFKVRY